MRNLITPVLSFLSSLVLRYWNHPIVVELFVKLAKLYSDRTSTRADDILVSNISEILYSKERTTEVKELVVELLRHYAEQTDNQVDNEVVDTVEKLLLTK